MKAFGENKLSTGWILYDDSCGFCRRGVWFWEKALRRRGFGIAALQEPWVMEKLKLPPVILLDDLRLLLTDGTHLAGADAYRYAMRRIWWTTPLYLFSVLPGCRWIFDSAYRLFAQNRHRLSAACGLK